MNRIFFLLLILSFSKLEAQNITISNIIKLQLLDITESVDYMENLNWKFTESLDNKNGLTYLTFTQVDANKRTVFLSKQYGEINFVLLSFYSKNKKISFVNNLKLNDFFLMGKEIEDGTIVEKYSNGNLIFTIGTKPNNEYYLSCGPIY